MQKHKILFYNQCKYLFFIPTLSGFTRQGPLVRSQYRPPPKTPTKSCASAKSGRTLPPPKPPFLSYWGKFGAKKIFCRVIHSFFWRKIFYDFHLIFGVFHTSYVPCFFPRFRPQPVPKNPGLPRLSQAFRTPPHGIFILLLYRAKAHFRASPALSQTIAFLHQDGSNARRLLVSC